MADLQSIWSGIGASVNTGKIGLGIQILAVFILIAVIVGVVVWFIAMTRLYNKKIVIFENLSGRGYVPNGKDTARIIKVGVEGEEILKLRKRKVLRTAYGKKIGVNTYAFAIGPDGYWINIDFGDLLVNGKTGEMQLNPIDRDMRMMHSAVRRNMEKRFDQMNFMQKYGGILAGFFLVIVMSIGFWFITRELNQTASIINQGIGASNLLLEKTANIIASLDNICTRAGVN